MHASLRKCMSFEFFGHILHIKFAEKSVFRKKKRVFRNPFKNGLRTKMGDRKCSFTWQAKNMELV